jgi:hypothetical protein
VALGPTLVALAVALEMDLMPPALAIAKPRAFVVALVASFWQ